MTLCQMTLGQVTSYQRVSLIDMLLFLGFRASRIAFMMKFSETSCAAKSPCGSIFTGVTTALLVISRIIGEIR